MNAKSYIEKMIKIQTNFLEYLDDEVNIDEKYQNLKNILNDYKVLDNRHHLKSFLCLISKISNNHQRLSNFFNKLKSIFQLIKDDLKKYFTNAELFRIFGSNKRILLLLLEETLITIDSYFIKQIVTEEYQSAKYPQYFSPEIKLIINEEWFPLKSHFYYEYSGHRTFLVTELNEEFSESFHENRKIGENDEYVCQLIQKDMIKEFIVFINKNSYSLNSNIKPSIFETNQFLLKQNSVSLIEYAVFYGSIQIFNYLKLNNVKMTQSLWFYAVHSQNAEIINSLEENCMPDNDFDKQKFFQKIFVESIKCHHNDVANYIQQNYLNEKKENSSSILNNCVKYYNFALIPNEIDNNFLFYCACKSDNFVIVEALLKETSIDINKHISKYSNEYVNFNLEIVKQTALYQAVKNESIEIIKLLLANENINVNFVNKKLNKVNQQEVYVDEKTALYLAVEKENIDIIKLLLTNYNINVNILYRHKDPEYEFNVCEKTALYLAVENKNIEIIKLLLTNDNIDVNILNTEQDFYRSKSGERLEMTALYLAVEQKNIETIKLLLTNDKLNINVLNKQLLYGYNISYKDYFYSEKTALYYAIECEDVEIVKLLLTNDKIDVNVLNKNDNYLLNKETYRDFFRDKILGKIEGRFYFNENNFHNGKGENSQNAALYAAVKKRNMAILKLLLACDKLDVNVINKVETKKFFDETNRTQIHAKTVLHLAVEKEYIEVIKLLLKNKSLSINIKDEQGKNPIDYASNSEIRQLFEYYLYQKKSNDFLNFYKKIF